MNFNFKTNINSYSMKKQKKNAHPYFPPVVETVDVAVENGFAGRLFQEI